MKALLKNAREQKGLKTREVAQLLGIDQALISKFESGTRNPTREQLSKLADLLDINLQNLTVLWLKEKIIQEIGGDDLALKALSQAEIELKTRNSVSNSSFPSTLKHLLLEIDNLNLQFDNLNAAEQNFIEKNLAIRFTYESNRIDENTMTFDETVQVINQGLTIAGKSMREHLEIVNHQEAIAAIKEVAEGNTFFNERKLFSIHQLLSRGIHPDGAGQYSNRSTLPKENTIDSQSIPEEMEAFFEWLETNKKIVPTIVLACESYIRLSKIRPFTYANGKMARLVLNLILSQHKYRIALLTKENDEKLNSLLTINSQDSDYNTEEILIYLVNAIKDSYRKTLNFVD